MECNGLFFKFIEKKKKSGERNSIRPSEYVQNLKRGKRKIQSMSDMEQNKKIWTKKTKGGSGILYTGIITFFFSHYTALDCPPNLSEPLKLLTLLIV